MKKRKKAWEENKKPHFRCWWWMMMTMIFRQRFVGIYLDSNGRYILSLIKYEFNFDYHNTKSLHQGKVNWAYFFLLHVLWTVNLICRGIEQTLVRMIISKIIIKLIKHNFDICKRVFIYWFPELLIFELLKSILL